MYEAVGNPTGWCFSWFAERKTQGGSLKAADLKAAKWNAGDRITISFLDGDTELQGRVKEAAETWIAPDMARLSFDYRPTGEKTMIRISFRKPGSWSVIGTTCKQLASQTEPTMNFGWIDRSSPDEVLRPVVLHEFGHALGLIHEHQHPEAPIVWDKDVVRRELKESNNWSNEVIDFNMFHAFESKETNYGEFDPESIMVYPIPANWTKNRFSCRLSTDLSAKDRKFIRQEYP